MINLSNDNRLLDYREMNAYNQLFCFSTTRHGGFSKGSYSSFNCTPYTGDDPADVAKNQQLLLSILPQGTTLVIPYQTHHTHTLKIDQNFLMASATERTQRLQDTDALITDNQGVCLCISTADCIPVLLYDKRRNAIANIHAGWKGTVSRIPALTIQAMQEAYGTHPEDLIAALGPGITKASFEVGNEVVEAFRIHGFKMSSIAFWHKEKKKYHIDLFEANRETLIQCGIPASQIYTDEICTYLHPDVFFSARREGIHSGRILTGIMLTNK